MTFKTKILFTALCASFVFSTAARAEDPVSLGKSDDWEAFTYHQDGAPVCYVMSAPKKSESDKKNAKRDPAYFMITHFAGKKVKGQISTNIGYAFKESSIVNLKVDAQNFELYTNGDSAWAADANTEVKVVKAMKTSKSSTFTVAGTSFRGTQTVDTYSLAGIDQALAKIDTTCK
ncbi:invasion associated locus B family protein [Aestuariivirga litoralis]|uniref:invasion associated locus B family protein n=1 Tax=Aestuariivirga litoralis TaxID=2650924 RepID=UPI0018C4D0B8|nr:invasion associated locus B family protein [Aestuariivirga litoralis]MBG1233525.1 hypothetical protein [Aestuariivirga litoralis]